MIKKINFFLFLLFIVLSTLIPLSVKGIENTTPINKNIDQSLSSVSLCEAGDNEICLNVPIGDTQSMSLTSALSDYIKLWYSFIIGAIGIFATVMIMYGGLKWLTSRGNSAIIGDAKEKIFSALIGLVLAFLSYTILYLINPNLTIIKTPSLPSISEITYTGTAQQTIDSLPGESSLLFSKPQDLANAITNNLSLKYQQENPGKTNPTIIKTDGSYGIVNIADTGWDDNASYFMITGDSDFINYVSQNFSRETGFSSESYPHIYSNNDIYSKPTYFIWMEDGGFLVSDSLQFVTNVGNFTNNGGGITLSSNIREIIKGL